MGRRFNPQSRCKPFKRPTAEQEIAALGTSAGVWGQLLSSGIFPKLPKPSRDDWLGVVEERAQSLASFERFSMRARIHHTYRTLYLAPMSWQGDESVEVLKAARAYLQAFFPGLYVELTKAVQVQPHRNHPEEGHEQILTADAYVALGSLRMQRDVARTAVGVVGLTTLDLYPGEEWDHVAGEALPMNSVGVVSWYRCSQWDNDHASVASGLEPPPPFALALRRFVCTLSHEVCHLFGLHHCIFRHCLMNGSNHQAEADSRPESLCAVCLRKLYRGLGVHEDCDEAVSLWIRDRQAGLRTWYAENGLDPFELESLDVALKAIDC